MIPAKLRRALEDRYPTCGVKSCANDQFLQIDHVVPLEAGGETNVHNTWRICSHHHFLKTYAGWTVVGEHGNWDLVPPDDPDPPAGPSARDGESGSCSACESPVRGTTTWGGVVDVYR